MKVQIDYGIYGEPRTFELTVVPRKGERVCLNHTGAYTTVETVTYLLAPKEGQPDVYIQTS